GLDAAGQLLGLALAPEVREVEGGLLADHVVVQRDDVDVRLAQRPQHWLHFLCRHDEVPINGCQVVAAGESRPGRQPHRAAHLDAVHASLGADRYFDHAGLRIALVAEDLPQGFRLDRPRLRRIALDPRRRLRAVGADLLDGVPDTFDGCGQLLGVALTADV